VAIGQEVLATSKLPMALDYLVGELKLVGTLSTAMSRLPHYFTAFQTFVMRQAEEETGRFDIRTALSILEREAAYRAEGATPQGLFFYRFECLSRNRLDYGHGLAAIAVDDIFSADWKHWIETVSRQVGLIDLADLVYVRSPEYWRLEKRDALLAGRTGPEPDRPILFGEKEGRIARANRGKDPLFFFAALQRQLSGHTTDQEPGPRCGVTGAARPPARAAGDAGEAPGGGRPRRHRPVAVRSQAVPASRGHGRWLKRRGSGPMRRRCERPRSPRWLRRRSWPGGWPWRTAGSYAPGRRRLPRSISTRSIGSWSWAPAKRPRAWRRGSSACSAPSGSRGIASRAW
jgi:hypothetical protein